MRDLEFNELKEIKGGAVSPWLIVGLAALFTFVAGAVDGYVRPLTCHK